MLSHIMDRWVDLLQAWAQTPPRLIERHYGVITSITPQGVFAQLDGNTHGAPCGPFQYNGSVPPPNPGESWAFGVVQREWVAEYRLIAGEGSLPVYDPSGSAALAQANAKVNSDFKIDFLHNVPGLIPANTTLANCPAGQVFGTLVGASTLYLDLVLATPDTDGAGVEWDWYYNGTLYQTLTIPVGAASVSAEIPVGDFGQPGDTIQGLVNGYTGTTASSLTSHFRVR